MKIKIIKKACQRMRRFSSISTSWFSLGWQNRIRNYMYHVTLIAFRVTKRCAKFSKKLIYIHFSITGRIRWSYTLNFIIRRLDTWPRTVLAFRTSITAKLIISISRTLIIRDLSNYIAREYGCIGNRCPSRRTRISPSLIRVGREAE